MSFPNTLDTTSTIPVESGSTPLSTNHVINHTAMQTAIIAIETLIGVTASAVAGTFNYILGEITGTDKAVGKTATQTLTNKTLTAPTITGATITTSTINGVNIQTNGSATDFLAANGTYQTGAVANASTTVKGIVEAATSAEVTAGTATGGTGAALVVTPDALAASTPVFNGSGLTNMNFLGAASSTNLKFSADTERHSVGQTYVKLKEIKTYVAGTISVSFDMKISANTAYGRIYKNGSAIGTERISSSTTYITYTEDIDVVYGDLIQLYVKSDYTIGDTYIQNFRMKYDYTTKPQMTVVTN